MNPSPIVSVLLENVWEDPDKILYPDWDEGESIRNWQYYVDGRVREAWPTLTDETKVCVYIHCNRTALIISELTWH